MPDTDSTSRSAMVEMFFGLTREMVLSYGEQYGYTADDVQELLVFVSYRWNGKLMSTKIGEYEFTLMMDAIHASFPNGKNALAIFILVKNETAMWQEIQHDLGSISRGTQTEENFMGAYVRYLHRLFTKMTWQGMIGVPCFVNYCGGDVDFHNSRDLKVMADIWRKYGEDGVRTAATLMLREMRLDAIYHILENDIDLALVTNTMASSATT